MGGAFSASSVLTWTFIGTVDCYTNYDLLTDN